MHEFSIIAALMEQCEEHARNAKASRIDKVIISVGVCSGIEQALLQHAFDAFKEEHPLTHSAELEIHTQPIVLLCRQCAKKSTPKPHHYASCPHCASHDVSIISGKDLLLLRLEMLGD